MAVSRAKLRRLSKYLEGDRPNSEGEWGMHCPFHHDVNRSASLNVDTELWYCNTCDIGGVVDELVQRLDSGEATVAGWGEEHSPKTRHSKNGQGRKPPEVTEAQARGWHAALMSREEELETLLLRRGLSMDTVSRFQIGWDTDQDAYTIPVRNAAGDVTNIRFYQLDPSDDRRKIWSVMGHGEPVIYPISMLDGNREIVICEGEWDALLTIQNGFAAVTRTGAAKVWKDSWNPLFEDKCVYLCHDMDDPGQIGNLKVQAALRDYAAEVKIVMLPYRVVPKNGKDLTDFWMAGFEPGDFKELLNDSEGVTRDPELVESEVVDVQVLDSFDASQAGRKMRLRATIIGKRTPPFLLPLEVDYQCTQDAGPQCQVCPMLGYDGQAMRHIGSHEPVLLEMMRASKPQLNELLRKHMGAQKCNRLDIVPVEMRTVETLHVRSSVDHNIGATEAGDHTTREIVSVGSHDAEANRSVELVGTIYPDPRDQSNKFQAWEVTRTTTTFDTFEITDDAVALMLLFQPGERGPVHKLSHIGDQLANGVTRIYGRRRMHALMDLVWHSVLSFDFTGVRQPRGWLDALIVGDTRTGKSEAAARLLEWYGAGEMVSCESATFAGIVGGLQQFSGKEWEITWGTIPLNDRRLVVLDEVSGLTVEQIGQMSSIRSSGEAQLTKIRDDRTWARTRLLWMGNPRNAGMDDFTYGLHAIAPLIGNKEDIARFDLAMSIRTDDVDPELINMRHKDETSRYSREACQTLLRWCWSRKPEQVKWGTDAENLVHQVALELGSIFVEEPPLIQRANVRFKVARIAVALAARTFSTDETHENVIVTKAHVRGAKEILVTLYGDPGFGYLDISSERKSEIRKAVQESDRAKEWLWSNDDLVRFLRNQRDGHFRRQDLEDMLVMDRDQSASAVNQLFSFGLVRRDRANVVMEPMLHQLLRELRGKGDRIDKNS